MNQKIDRSKFGVVGQRVDTNIKGEFSLIMIDAILTVAGLEALGNAGITDVDFGGLEICHAENSTEFKQNIISQFQQMGVVAVRFSRRQEFQVIFGSEIRLVAWVDVYSSACDHPTAYQIVQEAIASMSEIEITRESIHEEET